MKQLGPLAGIRWPGIAAVVALTMTQSAFAQGMLLSNRDHALAVNAWGGARNGGELKLHNACRADNPDCRWSYIGGLLVNDTNLAISVTSATHGAPLVLMANCSRARRECTWSYRNGMFVSDANPELAINAWGGARFGTALRLSRDCRPNNPDCTWSR